MESKTKEKPVVLLVADLAILNGIVLGFLYLSSNQWAEALAVISIAMLGGCYLVRNGVYWPGQSIVRYWRRYVL